MLVPGQPRSKSKQNRLRPAASLVQPQTLIYVLSSFFSRFNTDLKEYQQRAQNSWLNDCTISSRCIYGANANSCCCNLHFNELKLKGNWLHPQPHSQGSLQIVTLFHCKLHVSWNFRRKRKLLNAGSSHGPAYKNLTNQNVYCWRIFARVSKYFPTDKYLKAWTQLSWKPKVEVLKYWSSTDWRLNLGMGGHQVWGTARWWSEIMRGRVEGRGTEDEGRTEKGGEGGRRPNHSPILS